MWAVGWQGAQDVKRSERPRPVSAGAAARNHAPTYDTKLLTLTLDARAPKSQAKSLGRRNESKIYFGWWGALKVIVGLGGFVVDLGAQG